jgi:hypothetical protein
MSSVISAAGWKKPYLAISYFERFVPVFVSYFLERALRALKTEGSIDDYRTRTVRTGKFCYRIDIRLVLTAGQAKIILNDLVTKILRIFGWDNDN